MYHWPNIPPPFTPRAMRFWACGPGGWTPGSPGRRSPGPVGAGDPQVRWLLPVQVPGRHRLPVKLFVHAMPPAGGLSLNATTAGAVRLVQLRPDAGFVPGRRRGPGNLAGKPLTGFRAKPSRRIPVLYGPVVLFSVNYFCRLASIILAGSPPVSDHAAGPLRCGSWARRIQG